MNNQLRKHLNFNIFNYLRQFILKFQLGKTGKKVFIDSNVQFLRFPKNIYIGNNVVFKEGSKIASCNNRARVYIDDNTTIGYSTFIFSSDEIKIGKNCLISSFVYIVDSMHGISRNENINSQLENKKKIIIYDDVWIGQGATILPGVEIAKGSVIGAGSVLTKSTEEYSIYAGNPAKKIGSRS